ncbi:hypothetical protein [Kribbella sp. CA-293567]|uniref:hypothetical protein n=1 Tax=Kribbella sp. CA-293567 TaxID=3002436 RepID=UPI0022DD010F|nr:hypothetical protein [Kribbella sp. CA-293567]WBQ02285.1 hypothetical protein OX958_20080 [Kribbella sp. CA-293567]
MKHWVRRTVLLIALTTLGISALPAHAGGPTSVLLSSRDAGKVVATGYNDKAYAELQALLDTQPKGEADAEHHGVGTFVRATWLIHDVTPWRLDVIYPDAPGGPWIATTEDRGGSGRLPDQPTWHRAADGVRLVKLLVSLGLLHRNNSDRNNSDSGNFGGPTTLPQAAPQTPPEVAAIDDTATDDTATAAIRTEEKPLLGWRWSIPGFLLGAAATYLFLRYLPRRRWQLIDEE